MALVWLLFCASLIHVIAAKGSDYKVECSPQMMKVIVPMDGNRKLSYLDQMKDYEPCSPSIQNGVAMYLLDLDDPHRCGVTRVLNKITGKRVFYHKIVIEDMIGAPELLEVRCVVIPEKSQAPAEVAGEGAPHAIARRAAADLPFGFEEPEILDITTSYETKAPEPQLGVAVRQNGKKVSGEISVNPGTPLSMEIFLDNSSAPVYGLLASYMQVTDTKQQQETIIFNGCSVDPYLFDNFVTTDGDKLTAKFRAFKFPDTAYVQFKGTVTVCLDKCQGVTCSNGVTGYGRRRRSIDDSGASNRVYEVSLTTFIKVDYLNGDKEAEEILGLLKNLKISNQMLEEHNGGSLLNGAPATVREKTKNNELKPHTEALNSSSLATNNALVSLTFLLILILFK